MQIRSHFDGMHIKKALQTISHNIILKTVEENRLTVKKATSGENYFENEKKKAPVFSIWYARMKSANHIFCFADIVNSFDHKIPGSIVMQAVAPSICLWFLCRPFYFSTCVL